MEMMHLQPKHYHLRLSLEQVQHTVDGWVENRKLIDEQSLPFYDNQLTNVVHQFRQQGVEIELELANQTSREDEITQAAVWVTNTTALIWKLSMDPMERNLILDKITEMEKLLFGDIVEPVQK